jgi:hypothetical protein
MNLNKSWSKNETNKRLRMASMAMRMPSDLGSSGLGSVQRRFTNEIGNEMFSPELEMRKESRLNSVKLVKRKIQISYKLEYNNFML